MPLTIQLSGSSYEFSGAGEISSNGAVALTGDMSLQGRIADDLRQGDLGLNVILGESGPIVFPVQVDGEYPVLSVVPEAAFLRELSGRARRSLGGGLGQQLREALRP